MGKVIRNALVCAAAIVVFVVAGFAIGSTGFRWNQFFKEGFWGFTSHQWGILLSGIVGAIAGGAVAILVLWGTLRGQARWTKAQLAQASEHLESTLANQKALFLEEQKLAEDRYRSSNALDALLKWSEELQTIEVRRDLDDSSVGMAFRELTRPNGAFRRGPERWRDLVPICRDVSAAYLYCFGNEAMAALTPKDRNDIERQFRKIGFVLGTWDADDDTSRKGVIESVCDSLYEIAVMFDQRGVQYQLASAARRPSSA